MKVFSIALLLLLLTPFSWAQKKAEKAPFKVLHADAVSHGDNRQELVGNVIIEREGIRLYAGRMVYTKSIGLLEAWRNVEIRDPSFNLKCARLTLKTKENEAVAWGNPLLTQKEKKNDKSNETTLTGVQVRIFSKEKRVQVLEDVVLTRYEIKGEKKVVELRVRCRSMDALTAAKRSTFKGGITVETPQIGAGAERALYDQLSNKFYLIGAAKAWNFDSSGRKVNLIEGDKIVYFTREKRTVVIGNVTADVEPEIKTGERTIPVRMDPVSRPGEVMINE